ncbi:MAG: hypothetical protein MZV70_33560 [Desulfobacterales bacterium]|nr:hypothetical protein [Desulfobacterales bacterium]
MAGYVLNIDGERLEKVVGLMTENLALTGKRFCPRKQSHPLDPDRDVVCPCPEWKSETETVKGTASADSSSWWKTDEAGRGIGRSAPVGNNGGCKSIADDGNCAGPAAGLRCPEAPSARSLPWRNDP